MIDVTRKVLPEGWQWATMDDIAEVIGGGTPKSKEKRYFEGGDIPWLTPADLSGYTAKHISKGARNITEAGLNSSSAKLMPAGTVLFTSRAPIGYVAIATNEISTNQGFKSFVLKSEDILPDYIYWWLKGNKQLAESMASGTTFLELSGSKAKQLPIPIAPPEQQKRIVAKIEELFSHIDAGIEALKKSKQLLKQYRQSVLKAAVTGELTKEWREANKDKLEPASQLLERILETRRQLWEEQQLEQFKAKGKTPKDDKWKEKYKEPESGSDRFFSEIPDEWAMASIDQLAWDVRYGSSSKTNDNEKGIPVLRMGNIVDGQLDYTNLKYLPKDHGEFPDLLLEDGDLLFNRTNSAELVGKSAVYRDIGRQASLASYLIRVRLVSGVEPDYAAYFINSSCGRNWIKSCVSQNVGQANVNGTKLKALVMPLPSPEEQKEIVRIVEEKMQSSDRLLSELDHQFLKVEKNKQSILASAFTGTV